MRIYTAKSPWTDKTRLVVQSDILLAHNKNARGAALGWVVFQKKPVEDYVLTTDALRFEKWVCSDSGCKLAIQNLYHELFHCDRQTGQLKNGKVYKVNPFKQLINIVKWIRRYYNDRHFQYYEEKLAKAAESGK